MGGIAIVNLASERIVAGNDVPIMWDVVDGNSDYYDWIGVTKMWFCIKEKSHDADTDAIVLINSTDNPTQVKYDYPTVDVGQCWVELSVTDTTDLNTYGELFYEVKVLKSGKVNTLIQGNIKFLPGRIEAIS